MTRLNCDIEFHITPQNIDCDPQNIDCDPQNIDCDPQNIDCDYKLEPPQ